MARRWQGCAMILLVLTLSHAGAQDIPGLEGCMAEKQMERRTGCLQSNDEYLQRTLFKLRSGMQARLSASGRDLAAAQAEIAALKSAIEKLNGELAQLKAKVEAAGKK
jgi:chromosome segregation ATPase